MNTFILSKHVTVILIIAVFMVVACGVLAGILFFRPGGDFAHALAAVVKSPPKYSETTLCAYKKDVEGGFSPNWVAYIIRPAEEAKDQSVFVEVNGKRFGPYTNVSGLIEVSRDGKHIAYAAEKNGMWVVAIDGVEKYTHKGLLWPWMGWAPTVEGNSYTPQTRAVALEFSPDGKSLAYPAQMDDNKYAVFVNGKPSAAYAKVGAEIHFVDGNVKYYAFPAEKQIIVAHGTQMFGPYDTSYKTKYSEDGKHYVFWASKGEKHILVADGKAHELPGEVGDYAIGNGGFLAYSYKQGGKCHVREGNTDLPGEFDEVTQLVVSPDGKKIAFWARRGDTWTVSAMGKDFPGFGGYYYYKSGSKTYGLMWSPDSQHIAYYTRSPRSFVLDGVQLAGFTPPGIMLQVIVDDQGRDVGAAMMSGPETDQKALVQAALMRDKAKCEPFAAALFGGQLCCVEKIDKTAFMWIGNKREGPYAEINSVLLTAPASKHYTYIVKTAAGEQVVVDGLLMPHVYDALYRPVFNDEDGELDILALKGGNLLKVVQPLRMEGVAKPQ
jgi:hypothetical protein